MDRRTRQQSINHWESVVDAHEASGLSVRHFCNQRNIAQTQFYKWRKRLSRIAPLQQGTKTMPVTLLRPRSACDETQIEIRVDTSISIIVGRGFDADTLGRVLQTLKHGTAGDSSKC